MLKRIPDNVIKILIVAITVITISLMCFHTYCEYTYDKIGECFTQENYKLALHYTENLPKNYKDVRKIKNLINLIENFDETDTRDYKRAIPLLAEFKGFRNEDVNFYYNNFYIRIIEEQKAAEFDAKIKSFESKNDQKEQTTTKTDELTAKINKEYVVFYLESSEVYHLYRDCTTLSNSKNVLTGKIPEERRVCKVCEKR